MNQQFKPIAAAFFALLVLQGCDAFDPSLLKSRDSLSVMNAPDAHASDNSDASTDEREHARDAQAIEGNAPDARPRDAAIHDAGDNSDPMPVCEGDDAGTDDSDDDGLPDCIDACPDDPEKSSPGLCGCSHPDSDEGDIVSCGGLRDALAHRYRFSASGTTATDARGSASGIVVGTQTHSSGVLVLAGVQTDQYVDLPNGIVSSLTNATFEAWITWDGISNWERIFDFGDSDGASEGDQGLGASYIMLSPRVNVTETMRAAYAANGPDSAVFVDAPIALPIGGKHHVALVFDDSNDALRIYVDGVLQGSGLMTGSLSSIRDKNNWLGRSQYVLDPELGGALHEFRIYDSALSEAQIALSFASGSDPAFLTQPE